MGFQDQFGTRYDTKRPHPPPPPLHQQQSQQPQHHMQHAQQSQQQQHHHLLQQQQQAPQQPQPQQPQQQQPPPATQQQHLPSAPPPSHTPASPSFSFDSLDHADLSGVGSASPAAGHIAKKPKPNPPALNGQPLPPTQPLPQQQQVQVLQQQQQQQQQPPQAQAKRPASRATTWTKVEEERLRVLVECGTKWQAITKEFPNRTAGAIKKHYYADMKHTTWNPDEDTKLTEAVKEDEDQKWKRVAEKVGKPAKACEKRMKELMKLQQPGAGQ
ncbi:hypothetical protein POJ06DRAFT_246956 [Lipomyces tetrasporus]|uniref:Uncharacterized protein n=1 Tax=Lipomyces tetrasporus TaxID=54092 RepID=A0AAD7QXQ2_9ASCO|nr:uncharacterized protein POJ06DRAFT_246956 [Lipomyces tetrasporus]KAJ8103231.1 hypothetical protein POJ06DRAFT_246956 [Lipomyces tetrasporus]